MKTHANKGRKQSPEHIAKRVAAYRGRSLSEEHKRKLAAIPRSEETKGKIRLARERQKDALVGNPGEPNNPARRWWAELKADPMKYGRYIARLKRRPQLWKKGKVWNPDQIEKSARTRTGMPHPHTAEQDRKIGEANAISLLGKTHSEETKRKMSVAHKGWATVPPERRNYGPDHHNWGKPAPKGSGIGKGSYCFKGHYVRSTWERGVADWLYMNEVEYEYEKHLFDLGDGLRFRPDFYLTKYDMWVEVKGYETERDREKFSRFIKEGNRLIIIDKNVWRFFQDTGIMAFPDLQVA